MSLPRTPAIQISGWPCRKLEMRTAQVWTQLDSRTWDVLLTNTHTKPELQRRVSQEKILCLQQWEAIRKSAYLCHSFNNYNENHTSSLCTKWPWNCYMDMDVSLYYLHVQKNVNQKRIKENKVVSTTWSDESQHKPSLEESRATLTL